MTKRVLVVHYSQTGQLSDVVGAFIKPLQDDPNIEVVSKRLEPEVAYPFPWPFLEFFSIFPETVYMRPPRMKALEIEDAKSFDLVILGYQAWFLSPSLPTTGFLRSDLASKVLRDKPVITLIACRDMWLTAQEKVKRELERLQARLLDNVVLVDGCGSAASFLATPLWMFTGRRGPFGFIPAAGVSQQDIDGCQRFGSRIRQALNDPATTLDSPLLKGLGAVKIKEKMIASEAMAHRSFLVWGKILMAAGSQKSLSRRIVLCFYIAFLITLIFTVVPISALIKKLLSPFTKVRIENQKRYYSYPSGENRDLLEVDKQ